MKILICLAMSCGLTAILYFYLKHKLCVIETRLNTLTDLAQTLATELYNNEKQKESVLSKENVLEDESEDESEDETDDESDDETKSDSEPEEYVVIHELPVANNISPIVFKEIKVEPETKQIPLHEVIEIDPVPIIVCKQEESHVENLIEVSDDESVKKVTIDKEYSQFSLKDLKQKVNDLGGPPLKTKQALINFLKKKV